MGKCKILASGLLVCSYALSRGQKHVFSRAVLNVAIISTISESGLFVVLAGLSLMGLMLTIFLLPEPKRLDLEESSGENMLLAAGKGVAAHK